MEERVNPLLGRKEAKLVVHHAGAGTPDRITVRKMASEHFKAPLDRVFVKSISTRTGGSSALCTVEIYEDASSAERVVPPYLKNRNLPKDQRVSKKKGEEAKPAPAAKPAAAPATKPAAEKKAVAEAKPVAEKKAAPEAKAPAKADAGKETKPAPAKPATK